MPASSSQFTQLLGRLLHSQDRRPHVCVCFRYAPPGQTSLLSSPPTGPACLSGTSAQHEAPTELTCIPPKPVLSPCQSSHCPPTCSSQKLSGVPMFSLYSPPRPRNSHSRMRSHLPSPLQFHELCPDAGHQVSHLDNRCSSLFSLPASRLFPFTVVREQIAESIQAKWERVQSSPGGWNSGQVLARSAG